LRIDTSYHCAAMPVPFEFLYHKRALNLLQGKRQSELYQSVIANIPAKGA